MELRRKRAVILAALPASMTACFVAITARSTNPHTSHIFFGIWLLFVLCCFAFAIRELRALKSEGQCKK